MELVPPRTISFSGAWPDVVHEEILVLIIQNIVTLSTRLSMTFLLLWKA